MIAAAPYHNENLEILKLTLSLISSNEKKIPSSLKERFKTTIEQAMELVQDPSTVSKDTLSESIDLALEMKHHEKLTAEISKISSFEDITPEVASRLLSEMK